MGKNYLIKLRPFVRALPIFLCFIILYQKLIFGLSETELKKVKMACFNGNVEMCEKMDQIKEKEQEKLSRIKVNEHLLGIDKQRQEEERLRKEEALNAQKQKQEEEEESKKEKKDDTKKESNPKDDKVAMKALKEVQKAS